MKAINCSKYGPPEVLQLREVEKPVLKDDEVLIKKYSTSVTASDCIIRGFKLQVKIWILSMLASGITKPRRALQGLELL